MLAWGRHDVEWEREALAGDIWPLGLARNRANIERFADYSVDIGLISKRPVTDELFASPLRAT
jgi:4,5-dihydroxyphthalate decarboxylase